MPVFHTKTIEGILEPVAQQVRAIVVLVSQQSAQVGGVSRGGQLIGAARTLILVLVCVCPPHAAACLHLGLRRGARLGAGGPAGLKPGRRRGGRAGRLINV